MVSMFVGEPNHAALPSHFHPDADLSREQWKDYCRALTDIRRFFEPRRCPFFWLFLSIISIEGMLNDCFLPITRTVAVVFIRDDHTLQN